jgi:hypothetical protein
VNTAGSKIASQAGGLLLTETIRTVGLDAQLSAALASWRHLNARHDPTKIVLDLAVTLALGGELPVRHRRAARRTRPVRTGGLGSDGVPDHRPARR